jgi:superfamily I DNA/RNA helicase
MLDALLLPEAHHQTPKLHPPSSDQLAAANSKARAANVIAGPGTGKTTTPVHRFKYLVEGEKIDPSQIFIPTFTN